MQRSQTGESEEQGRGAYLENLTFAISLFNFGRDPCRTLHRSCSLFDDCARCEQALDTCCSVFTLKQRRAGWCKSFEVDGSVVGHESRVQFTNLALAQGIVTRTQGSSRIRGALDRTRLHGRGGMSRLEDDECHNGIHISSRPVGGTRRSGITCVTMVNGVPKKQIHPGNRTSLRRWNVRR